MSEGWDAHSLAEVYARMVRAGAEFVIVGGQAVNLWAEYYRETEYFAPAVWEQFLPFVSRDLDCLSSSLDAKTVGRDFGVRPQVYDPFSKAWTPSAADLRLPLEINGAGRTLLVQFMHTAYGINSSEAENSARQLEWAGVTLRVLHPMLCVEGKLANLCNLDQERPPRQDLKHVRICSLVLHAFVRERLAAGQIREVLGLVERVMRLAGRHDGLKAWHRHALSLEDIVPIEALQTAAAAGERNASQFLKLRWPQLQTSLATRRAHFATVVNLHDKQRGTVPGPPAEPEP